MIKSLSDIPPNPQLKQLCQSIAMLEVIVMPDSQWRYYSFTKNWDDEIDLFSMRNGSGDEFIVVFTQHGVLIKGFAHESSISPYQVNPPQVYSGIIDTIPKPFTHIVKEPALNFIDTTFCFWKLQDSSEWLYGRQPSLNGEDVDGSQELLAILDGNPETYRSWAVEYYEEDIMSNPVQDIYDRKQLTVKLLKSLKSDCDPPKIVEEAHHIGYPVLSGQFD